MKKLGHVTVDGHRAAVVFHDLADDPLYFRVTITFHKPRSAPASRPLACG